MTRSRTMLAAVVGALVTAALVGCSSPGAAPSLTPQPSPTSTIAVTEDVPYRTVGSTALTVDVCRSKTETGPLPTVLLLHGGGFEAGDKLAMRQLCERLAAEGAVGVSVQYRLLPASSYPAQVQDAAAAVRWVRNATNAKRYGFDPDRVGILGSSAGAIIAESVGAGMGGTGSQVDAVVALSGASDFTKAGLALGKPGAAAEKIVLAYLGCTDITTCSTASAASPRLHVTAKSAPMLLFASSNEIVPSQQSVAMASALKAVKVPAEVKVVPGSAHGLALLTTANLRTIESFLLDRLR